MRWANQCGLDGIDCVEFARISAHIGTVAHERCAKLATHQMLTEYDGPFADGVNNAVDSFRLWQNDHKYIAVVKSELSLECDRYCGTCDLILDTPIGMMLVDIKTGTSIGQYVELQLEAYAHMYDLMQTNDSERIAYTAVIHLDRDKVAYKFTKMEHVTRVSGSARLPYPRNKLALAEFESMVETLRRRKIRLEDRHVWGN